MAEMSLEVLRGWGLEPEILEAKGASLPYLAASDHERAAQLQWAITSTDIRGIFCLRGGYGSMRILPMVKPQWLRENPKVLVGFSDLTALLLGLGGNGEVVTFHGPTLASSPLSRGAHSPTARRLKRVLMDGEEPDQLEGEPWSPGVAEGPLMGGCLSLVTALLGTPFMPSLDGSILFLEDVGEPLYRLDRMFQQLRLSGVLRRVAAVALGHVPASPSSRGLLRRVVLDALGSPVPVLAGLPCGHGPENMVLPLGCWAELDGDQGLLVVKEAAVGP